MKNTGVTEYDLLVIGGGINGTGIAADAARRGLSVHLVEKNDLASGTSSKSSKLIHGGLRYLEHFEFRLVKQALLEREVLLNIAPHLIKPLRFRLPHLPHLRPTWLIKAGLFLYDHLARRDHLSPSKKIKFAENSVLNDEIKEGFEYSDAWVDDARLVVLNAVTAKEHGAEIANYTECINAVRTPDNHWEVTLKNAEQEYIVYAKALINAAGPWVTQVFNLLPQLETPNAIRLVKGSHIVVPKLHNEPQAYILQHRDERIVFVIPYLDAFSLIGTTDVEYTGDPKDVCIDNNEINYLIDITNQYFKTQISTRDIVQTYSGVRPLLDDNASDAQAVSRDYSLELNDDNGCMPLLSVFGGKITTFRKLAQSAVNQLNPYFENLPKCSTAKQPIAGGDFTDIEQLKTQIAKDYPWLPDKLLSRWLTSYGTLMLNFLTGKKSLNDLGELFGCHLYQAEVDYLIEHEWAKTSDDILWRRTKLGLFLSAAEQTKLSEYLLKR